MIKYSHTTTILGILNQHYPNIKPDLNFSNDYEILVATILSAQCTDKRVNLVTPVLFKKYPNIEAMSKAELEDVTQIIRSCGLSNTKAKNIIASSIIITNDYDKKVPSDMSSLMQLPGVGRKTANVVLANAFGQDTIAVDTHVFRVSNRIGLANSNNVLGTEKQLMYNIDKKDWSTSHLLIIKHGRDTCKAQKPLCEICKLNRYCKYYSEIGEQGSV